MAKGKRTKIIRVDENFAFSLKSMQKNLREVYKEDISFIDTTKLIDMTMKNDKNFMKKLRRNDIF